MREGQPTPITRGIEIQQNRVRQLEEHASAQYKFLVNKLAAIAQSEQEELAKDPSQSDYGRLTALAAQRAAIEGVMGALDDLVLDTSKKLDELRESSMAFEEPTNATPQD